MFSQQYSTALVIVLVTLLPMFGIKTSNEELNTLIQAVFTLIGGIYIMYRRFKQGDIRVTGLRKEE